MELKEYYTEKDSECIKNSGALKGPDSWAIGYLNVGRAEGIMEAFDDDASGFVSVKEVNNLTRSRPRDWRCALCSPTCEDDPFTQIAAFPTG